MSNSTKRHPVILFPGITGSQLKTKNFLKAKSPLWFNRSQMWKLTCNLSSDKNSTQEEDSIVSESIVESYKTEADISKVTPFTPDEDWQNHMKLVFDGITPKVEYEEDNEDDKFNREVEGLEGIKNVSYPRLGFPALKSNEYFQALVDKLVETGYQENVDLIGYPYDWRVAPAGLERRYQTFTNLKTKIEELYNREKLPVVLIAHSMGNRLIQYFLTWMYTYDPDWVSKYIERYIAISPPWIGAPQAIYRLSDSDILLPAGKLQVALKGMKDVLQSFSSMPWLLPLQNEVGRYEYFNTEFFGYYAEVDSPNLDDYLPITVEETLEKAQAEDTTLVYQTIYYRDDLYITRRNSYIGSALIKCPPVRKLDVIYSTGFDTPVGAYYHFTDDKKLQIATKWGSPEVPEPFPHNTDLVIKQGIILETPKTEQKIQAEFPDHDPISNSGDSVVPYGSLAYFKKWKNLEPYRYIEGHQFSGDQNLNHNAIVSHPDVITRIIKLLSKEDAEV